MRKVVLLLLLLVGTLVARSQELNDDYTDVYVLDANTLKPIEGVLAMVANREAGTSDADGRLVFSRYVRNISPTLVFFKRGYALDSITLPYVPDTIYLQPLTGVLQEAIVTDKKVDLLLKSGTEYVVDYQFVDDKILVASYCKNGGKGAKLFILDDYGDTVVMKHINVPPKSLYRSCVGKYYLESYNDVYPITIDIDKRVLGLGKRVPLETIALLKQCQLYTDSVFYYKLADKRNFSVTFALAHDGDTILKPFKELYQPDVFMASIEDQMKVIKLLETGQFKEAAHIQRLAKMWDNSSFKCIDLPLFRKNDSLVIFDFDEHQIHFYSLSGYKFGMRAMQLDQGTLFRAKLIQDEITKEFFVLNERQSARDLRKVSLNDGVATGGTIRLEKPFANNIKIRDGKVYYLWHDGKGSPHQLYIQRNSIN